MPWAAAAQPPGVVGALLPARGPGEGERGAVETEAEPLPLPLHRGLRWWQLGAHHHFIFEARDVVQTVLLVATRLQVMPPEMWLAVLSMLVAEPASLFTSTVAGDGSDSGAGFQDGFGASARLNSPTGIAADPATGIVYVADTLNHRIRQLGKDGKLTTLTGRKFNGISMDGPLELARFCHPTGLVYHVAEHALFVAEGSARDHHNHRVRKINLLDGVVTTIAGSGRRGFKDGWGSKAQFNGPTGVCIDPLTGDVIVADRDNNRIRRISVSFNGDGNTVATCAGTGDFGSADGPASEATFKEPTGVAVLPDGTIIVAEQRGHRIRKIAPNDGRVSTLTGRAGRGFADGTVAAAQFRDPSGVAVSDSGDIIIADALNDRIRRLRSDGSVVTLVGRDHAFADGKTKHARFNSPVGVALLGDEIIVADCGNNCVRRISSEGQVAVLAGRIVPASEARRMRRYSLEGWWYKGAGPDVLALPPRKRGA